MAETFHIIERPAHAGTPRARASRRRPDDPGLPQLACLLDPARVADALPWRALGLRPAAIADIGIELLRHEPRRRATVRCTLVGRDGRPVRVVYGKTFCDDRAHELHARFEYFARRGRGAALHVATPLGWCAAMRTFWQAEAPGVPLAERLLALPPAPAAVRLRSVARALAQLHAAPAEMASAAEPRLLAHGVREARRARARLGRLPAALDARLARVVDGLAAQAPPLDLPAPTLIHGRFDPARLRVDGARVVLLDLGHLALGDPMEDLAAFVLKLAEARMAGELMSAFIDAYAVIAPGRFDVTRLDWHLAQQAFVQACRDIAAGRPGWSAALEQRLVASEVLAEPFAGVRRDASRRPYRQR